jgi:hypothetical protein
MCTPLILLGEVKEVQIGGEGSMHGKMKIHTLVGKSEAKRPLRSQS